MAPRTLIILVLLLMAICVNAAATTTYTDDTAVGVEDVQGIAIVANARGEYGKYWQWWPPGFVNKPQLMAESSNVWMHWGDEIANTYAEQGKNVHKLYSYNWINQNPTLQPIHLQEAIYSFIDQYSYHWNFIVLIGHANPEVWEAYYWNHNHETYYTTNMFIPDNDNWAPDDANVIATIDSYNVRERLGDNPWIRLPHIVFVIGCNSLDKLTDTGGWAWGFYLSESDYPSKWVYRGIVGFQGPIYYNWFTGDFKAAELVKRMIEYMNQGDSSILAFTKSANDLGFPYKVYTQPSYSEKGKGGGGEETYAVYIGKAAYQDPDASEVALRVALDFLKNYAPTVYDLVMNNSIQPSIVSEKDKWYSRLFGGPVYSVTWKIPLASRSHQDISFMIEVAITVLVDSGIGKIYDVYVGGSVYETPQIINEYGEEELGLVEEEIREYLHDDLNMLSNYAEQLLNIKPGSLGIKLIYRDAGNENYQIIYTPLQAPIYINDSNNIFPLQIRKIVQDSLFIFEDPLVLLPPKIRGTLPEPGITYNIANKILRDELLSMDNITIEKNLTLIVIVNVDNKNIKPYYHAVLKDDSGKAYMVFIDAYSGEKRVYVMNEAYVPNEGPDPFWFINEIPAEIMTAIVLLLPPLILITYVIYKKYLS